MSTVGAGSAGSVLASRLSEQPDVTVLLLEAGSDDRGRFIFEFPIVGQTVFKTRWTWDYYTERQEGLMTAKQGQVGVGVYVCVCVCVCV